MLYEIYLYVYISFVSYQSIVSVATTSPDSNESPPQTTSREKCQNAPRMFLPPHRTCNRTSGNSSRSDQFGRTRDFLLYQWQGMFKSCCSFRRFPLKIPGKIQKSLGARAWFTMRVVCMAKTLMVFCRQHLLSVACLCLKAYQMSLFFYFTLL